MRKILSSGIALSALLVTATTLYAQTSAPSAEELRRQQQGQGQGQGSGAATTPQNRPNAATPQGGVGASGSATTNQGGNSAQGSTQGAGSAQTGPGSTGTSAQGSGSTSGTTSGTAQQGTGSGSTSGGTAAQSGSSSTSTANVNITTEQRTTIRNEITTAKVEPARDINFNISIGVAIPRTIVLHTLPPRVVEIVPAYRAYRYFLLADGRIVIVDPNTYQIVVILTV